MTGMDGTAMTGGGPLPGLRIELDGRTGFEDPWVPMPATRRPALGAATATHVERIGFYAAALAHALDWSEWSLEEIRFAASLHDIGKIGVSLDILSKPGRLSQGEFATMRRHTEIGAAILSRSRHPVMRLAAEIALCHHERWDGGGYPHGLAGERIPMSARIVAVVDVYDALRDDRVYRSSLPRPRVLEMMRGERGRHFDPAVLDRFLELVELFGDFGSGRWPRPAGSSRGGDRGPRSAGRSRAPGAGGGRGEADGLAGFEAALRLGARGLLAAEGL